MKRKSTAIKSDLPRVDRQRGRPDAELPEITDELLDRAVFKVGETVLPTPRRRGRPAGTGKKQQVTLRLDRDVLSRFRAMGVGWQTRLNAALREWLRRHDNGAAAKRSKRAG